MPCYNTLLEQAIMRVIDQIYPELGLVVAVDGSSDNPFDIVKRITSIHPEKIRLLNARGG